MNPQPFPHVTFIIYPPSQCSYLYHFRRIIIKNSYRALNTFLFVVGTAGWEDFVESRDGSWSDPGSFQMPRKKEHTVFPPFGKDQDEDMNHAYFTHHELYEPELAIVPGWGSISMYPYRYVLYMCIYLALSLSLSLSLYIYNGFLPHFPFTACTCSYFCNKHTVDEVYCNEIHLICKDTSTYAKESRGQNFSPQQEPLVWKWIQKKGLYSAVLNPANSPSPSDLGRVDPFGGVVPPGPMAVA